MGATSTSPLDATITPSRPWLRMLTKTLRTWLLSKSTDSTKNTRSAPPDSMKRPGATRLTSSRLVKRSRRSSTWLMAHGVTNIDSSATAITIGQAKRITGPSQDSRLWPEANHTTISESRYARDSVISTEMKSVSVSTTGSQVRAVSASSWNTAWLSTRPPAAWPRMRTRPDRKQDREEHGEHRARGAGQLGDDRAAKDHRRRFRSFRGCGRHAAESAAELLLNLLRYRRYILPGSRDGPRRMPLLCRESPRRPTTRCHRETFQRENCNGI